LSAEEEDEYVVETWDTKERQRPEERVQRSSISPSGGSGGREKKLTSARGDLRSKAQQISSGGDRQEIDSEAVDIVFDSGAKKLGAESDHVLIRKSTKHSPKAGSEAVKTEKIKKTAEVGVQVASVPRPNPAVETRSVGVNVNFDPVDNNNHHQLLASLIFTQQSLVSALKEFTGYVRDLPEKVNSAAVCCCPGNLVQTVLGGQVDRSQQTKGEYWRFLGQ
jgi:hypothetical protein